MTSTVRRACSSGEGTPDRRTLQGSMQRSLPILPSAQLQLTCTGVGSTFALSESEVEGNVDSAIIPASCASECPPLATSMAVGAATTSSERVACQDFGAGNDTVLHTSAKGMATKSKFSLALLNAPGDNNLTLRQALGLPQHAVPRPVSDVSAPGEDNCSSSANVGVGLGSAVGVQSTPVANMIGTSKTASVHAMDSQRRKAWMLGGQPNSPASLSWSSPGLAFC